MGRPAVVVGFGSIGARLARALAPHAGELALVVRRPEPRAAASRAHPGATVVDGLAELDRRGFPWPEAVGVIATWGPSHAEFLAALADRGVPRVLCEKPMAASVADAAAMLRRAEADGMALGVNHTLRYARLAPGLRALAAAHGLGPMVGAALVGGAAGLATNGIHWIDAMTDLLGMPPVEARGTATAHPINPRSPDLDFFGGTVAWRYPDDRECAMTYTVGSSVMPVARVYFEAGAIECGYEPHGDDARLRFAVRTVPAGAWQPAAAPAEVRSFDEGLDRAAVEAVGDGAFTCPAHVGVEAVSTVIGGLLAGRSGGRVALPIAPDSPSGRMTWRMS